MGGLPCLGDNSNSLELLWAVYKVYVDPQIKKGLADVDYEFLFFYFIYLRRYRLKSGRLYYLVFRCMFYLFLPKRWLQNFSEHCGSAFGKSRYLSHYYTFNSTIFTSTTRLFFFKLLMHTYYAMFSMSSQSIVTSRHWFWVFCGFHAVASY